MEPSMNILSKLILLVLLALAGPAIWLLPKTRLVAGRQIGERLFVVTYVIGALCGAAGLAVLFALPQQTREWHLWELALMPLVFAYVFWFAVMRKARTSEVLDEKQDLDLAKAGGLAWGLSIPAMLLASLLSDAGAFDPALWFQYYILVTLLVHSTATLYYFKRR
jgi:hypothetical protein